jgi:RNA polymerase sigma factor (sigma-70 family)
MLFAHHRIPPEDAEDLVQQCLLAYLYKRGSIESFDRWLLGAVKKRCLMYWRGRRRRLYTAVDAAILDELAQEGLPEQEREDLRRDLAAVLAQLPPRCRRLLELRFGLGYDPSEAARRLGYRPSGIYKTTRRSSAAWRRWPAPCRGPGCWTASPSRRRRARSSSPRPASS